MCQNFAIISSLRMLVPWLILCDLILISRSVLNVFIRIYSLYIINLLKILLNCYLWLCVIIVDCLLVVFQMDNFYTGKFLLPMMPGKHLSLVTLDIAYSYNYDDVWLSLQ
uniref:Uncharacterized protein n=2 Tax=Rhizophora mucronata TaxID=61149 RepID=A0A2P2MAY1_RHIMU